MKSRLPILITAGVLILMVIIAGASFPNFLSLRVLTNLIADNAFLGIVAIGLTFVILTGGIDLSIGSTVGCASIMAASLLRDGNVPPVVAIGAPLLYGLALGAAQGFLISAYALPPFLVTLAGLFLGRGIALRISRESITINHPVFAGLADWRIALPGKAAITTPAAMFALVALIGIFVARQTAFGRTIYAIGGNAQSAQLMGLPVRRTLISAYMLSGFCAALGGIVFSIYTSSGNAIAGVGLELDAIAAVVIGGTLLSGGYGSPFGTVLGIAILGVVQTAIIFQGSLSSWWVRIVIGALLLVFLLVQRGIESIAMRSRIAVK